MNRVTIAVDRNTIVTASSLPRDLPPSHLSSQPFFGDGKGERADAPLPHGGASTAFRITLRDKTGKYVWVRGCSPCSCTAQRASKPWHANRGVGALLTVGRTPPAAGLP